MLADNGYTVTLNATLSAAYSIQTQARIPRGLLSDGEWHWVCFRCHPMKPVDAAKQATEQIWSEFLRRDFDAFCGRVEAEIREKHG